MIRATALLLAGLVAALAAPCAAADPPPVRVWEEPLVLPTYAMGAPDRNPIFVEHRSYQGADAPVYPYPMWDAIADERIDKTYRAVFLENRYVQLCVLPELGGRVFAARDKTNGYDFLYRQHVVKPALIGMVVSSGTFRITTGPRRSCRWTARSPSSPTAARPCGWANWNSGTGCAGWWNSGCGRIVRASSRRCD